MKRFTHALMAAGMILAGGQATAQHTSFPEVSTPAPTQITDIFSGTLWITEVSGMRMLMGLYGNGQCEIVLLQVGTDKKDIPLSCSYENVRQLSSDRFEFTMTQGLGEMQSTTVDTYRILSDGSLLSEVDNVTWKFLPPNGTATF